MRKSVFAAVGRPSARLSVNSTGASQANAGSVTLVGGALKMQKLKIKDQMSGPEKAGPAFSLPAYVVAGHKFPSRCMAHTSTQ